MDWNSIQTTWGFNVAFFVAVLISLVTTAYSLRRSRAVTRLCFIDFHLSFTANDASTTPSGYVWTMISKIPEVQEAGRAGFSRFTVWNEGDVPLKANDIATKRPLTFRVVGGGKILDARITHSTEAANDIAIGVLPDRTECTLSFDYLAKDDAFRCDIYHTGATVAFEGKLIGAPDSPERYVLQKGNNYLSLASDTLSGIAMLSFIWRGFLNRTDPISLFAGGASALVLPFVGYFAFRSLKRCTRDYGRKLIRQWGY